MAQVLEKGCVIETEGNAMFFKQGYSERGAFFAAASFYCLVAFEFFYMATPFAVYFYGVYGPGLELLSQYNSVNWLITFFMPHIVRQTSSTLINIHEFFGITLFVGGLLVFFIGVIQIYWSKLNKKSEVTGLLYRYIRHPQYLALMISGFGMVVVWPRYLVLFSFVTLVFIYFLLARLEERLCFAKYPGYGQYFERTGMFLPRALEAPFRALPSIKSRLARVGLGLTAYAITMALAMALALGIKSYAIGSIFGIYEDNTAILSLGDIPESRLRAVTEIAMADPEVKAAIAKIDKIATGPQKLIGYVLPVEFYVSEVPMHLPAGSNFGHAWPSDHNPDLYKIVLTKAFIPNNLDVRGRKIVSSAINKSPIIEAHVNIAARTVIARYEPPATAFYKGMPVPLY